MTDVQARTKIRSYSASAAYHAKAARYIPGSVNSNVRLAAPRICFSHGEGAWLWDIDGNDYVDYLLGQGPNFLGHAPSRIQHAVSRAARNGMMFGGQNELELEAAERVLRALVWADQVRFGVSGTESVQAALRLARAHTGRRFVVRFEGHYHGWLDNVLLGADGSSPGSLGQLGNHLDELIILAWNDAEAIKEVFATRGDEIAAVITEPMMLNAGAILPAPGYLETLRALCDSAGSLLIFDEVISGFRLSLGGASERFNVAPDLAVYGKALAAGWPVSALAGRREVMEKFGTGAVNHSGTFNASTMAMAAVVAALDQLHEDPPYDRIEVYGSQLMAGLMALARKHELDLRIQGVPCAFHLAFRDAPDATNFSDLKANDAARYVAFANSLADAGVWVAGRGVWYLSAQHAAPEISTTLERVERAIVERRP